MSVIQSVLEAKKTLVQGPFLILPEPRKPIRRQRRMSRGRMQIFVPKVMRQRPRGAGL